MDEQSLLSEFLAFYEKIGGEFCDFQTVTDSKRWLNTLVPAAAESLQVIGRQKSGSLICFWQQSPQHASEIDRPVVWLDSEGSPFSVFAPNFHTFLSLLPYDTGMIYDMVTAWEEYLETGDDWVVSTERFSDDKLKMYMDMTRENYPHYEQFIDWLKETGVEIANAPVQVIGEAIKNLPQLREWLDTLPKD